MYAHHATCSRSASESPIGAAVRALLGADDSPINVLDKRPIGARDYTFTKLELDLRDWGFCFGAVFALARNEDPWEPLDAVAERALQIAWAVHRDWGGDIELPERGAEITRLEEAYHAHDVERTLYESRDKVPGLGELMEAIVDVINKRGVRES